MRAVVSRLILLAGGLGFVEIGIGNALVDGSFAGWALLLMGLPLIAVGSVGFMGPLLGAAKQKGTSSDA